jgi:hypothetical protein
MPKPKTQSHNLGRGASYVARPKGPAIDQGESHAPTPGPGPCEWVF